MGSDQSPHGVRTSRRSGREPTNTDGAGRANGSPATGLSQFAGKVFEQLSLTSWFPAAVLVGNGAVLIQMHADRELSVAAAIQALTDKPLGILIVLLFALVIATVVTQAFEFEVIQILEGYDWTFGPAGAIAAARIRRHRQKLERLRRRLTNLREAAFALAKQKMAQDVPPEVLDLVVEQEEKGQLPDDLDPDLALEVEALDWRDYLPAEVRYRLETLVHQVETTYPEKESRILPTRLGNQLRAAEDEMPVGDRDVEGFVLRHFDRLPPALRQEQDDYRKRLDMYCSLVLVFAVLAAVGIWAVHSIAPVWITIAVAAGYLGMAYASYLAAVASARGQATALREIGAFVERELSQQELVEENSA